MLLTYIGVSFVLADSGDTGGCGIYSEPVEATYVEGACTNDDIAGYCDDWWSGSCPIWDQIRRKSDWRLYNCSSTETLIHSANYYDGEGTGVSLYFDRHGALAGVWQYTNAFTWCCEGQSAFDYKRGDVDCLIGTPFEDTGLSNPDSTADSQAGSEAESRSERPPGDKDPSCGCSGRNSATAAVFGLLLLARRWFKR